MSLQKWRSSEVQVNTLYILIGKKPVDKYLVEKLDNYCKLRMICASREFPCPADFIYTFPKGLTAKQIEALFEVMKLLIERIDT